MYGRYHEIDWEKLFWQELEYRETSRRLASDLNDLTIEWSRLFAYHRLCAEPSLDLIYPNFCDLYVLRKLHDVRNPKWNRSEKKQIADRLNSLIKRLSIDWEVNEIEYVDWAQMAYQSITKFELFDLLMEDLNPLTRENYEPFEDDEMRDIPESPPKEFADRLGVGYHWKRQAMVLYLIAAYGFSIRHEILSYLGEELNIKPDSGSLKDLVEKGLYKSHLVESGLISVNVANSKTRLRVVKLTDDGRELCRLLGWYPIESDWERLIRLHDGIHLERHTAAVLTFAYHARLRGWKVEIMPRESQGNYQPDIGLNRGHKYIDVEIELGENKTKKWQQAMENQGLVAFCAPTKKRRKRLITECISHRFWGIATDLESLIRDPEQEGKLWAETF
jgi:hypothetical protein